MLSLFLCVLTTSVIARLCVCSGRVVGVGVAASSVWLLAGTSRGKIYRVTVGDDEAVGTAHRRVLAAAEQETSHTRPITSVSFDGKRSDTVVTGSEDGRITVWDLSDYSAVRSFATSAVVTSVWMDELDGTVCAGCDDGALRCFEPGVESASWKLATHRGRVNTVTGTAAFLATGGDDSRVCVWSRRTRELLIQFVDHAKAVMEVVLDVASPSLLHSVGADRYGVVSPTGSPCTGCSLILAAVVAVWLCVVRVRTCVRVCAGPCTRLTSRPSDGWWAIS